MWEKTPKRRKWKTEQNNAELEIHDEVNETKR